jgi:hypothetical protein
MVADGDLAVAAHHLDLPVFDGGQIDLVPGTPPETVFTQELRRVRLGGKVADYVVPDRCNLIECRLDHFETDAVDFSRCDFKDNAIVECRFTKTKFVGTGFALNTISKSRFEACNFFDTVIQNCEFYDVEFHGCDFTSLVIKDCAFARCSFSRCKTSNKLFEMCLLNGCHFENTELQLQTITENFGLRANEVSLALRSDRLDHPHEAVDRVALENRLTREVRPLARLALHFFLTGSLLEGSEHLDAALDVGFWIRTQSTIGSFSTVLTRLCEFLLHLHEQNELAYLPLVQLHAVTGTLASAVPPDSRMRQAAFAVYGAHLSIARQIDDFGIAVRKFAESRRRNWTFLVEGKCPRSNYRRELRELFERGRPRIVSLVPHNSPWEMALSFPSAATVGAFFGLFLATRTRIEIRRLLDTVAPLPTSRGRSKSNRVQVAQLTLGAAKGAEAKPLVHLTTQISPTLAADFQLSVSTKCIGRVRRLVLAWLK